MTAVVTVTPNPVASGGTAITIAGTGFETRKTAVLLDGVEIDSFLVTDGTFSVATTASTTATTQHVVVQQCVAGSYLQKATATITVQDSLPADTPFADMTGWRLVFADEFDRGIGETHFIDGATSTAYGWKTSDLRYLVWKDGWPSTPPYQVGRADPSIISVHDSMLDIHLQTRDGYPRFATITALPSGSSVRGGLVGMRRHIKIKADSMAGWKGVPLLWADLSTTNDLLKTYGEIDWPESSFDDNPHGYMHRTNASTLSDQYIAIPSPDTVSWQTWHDYVIEWLPADATTHTGGSVKFFIDGVQVGTTQTSRVPWTAMHANVPQTEPNLSYTPPNPAVSGHVYVDRIGIWVPA